MTEQEKEKEKDKALKQFTDSLEKARESFKRVVNLVNEKPGSN